MCFKEILNSSQGDVRDKFKRISAFFYIATMVALRAADESLKLQRAMFSLANE